MPLGHGPPPGGHPTVPTRKPRIGYTYATGRTCQGGGTRCGAPRQLGVREVDQVSQGEGEGRTAALSDHGLACHGRFSTSCTRASR